MINSGQNYRVPCEGRQENNEPIQQSLSSTRWSNGISSYVGQRGKQHRAARSKSNNGKFDLQARIENSRDTTCSPDDYNHIGSNKVVCILFVPCQNCLAILFKFNTV